MLKDEILIDFEKNRGVPLSGQMLADLHQVSRNAVWKAVNSLKEDGYEIIVARNKGYYIPVESDVLSAKAIRLHLRGDYGRNREGLSGLAVDVFETIDSTNTEAKRQLITGEPELPKLIVANEQTKGRGRIGKHFYSPADSGIYMSLLYHLEKPLQRAELVTLAAAVAVVRVLQPFFSEKLRLKWVNDIFYEDRKICGILSEAVSDLEAGQIQNIVVGIGINLKRVAFPEELAGIAGSANLDQVNRNEVIAKITDQLCSLYQNPEDTSFLAEYFEHARDLSEIPQEIRRIYGLAD